MTQNCSQWLMANAGRLRAAMAFGRIIASVAPTVPNESAVMKPILVGRS